MGYFNKVHWFNFVTYTCLYCENAFPIKVLSGKEGACYDVPTLSLCRYKLPVKKLQMSKTKTSRGHKAGCG